MSSAREAVEAFRLAPDPTEGWSRQTDHVPDRLRSVLHLIAAPGFLPWHEAPAETLWSAEEGGAAVLTQSMDGVTARAIHLGLGAGLQRWARVPAGAFHTLEPLGHWSLLRATFVPDASPADRRLAPDDWFPGGGRP